MLIKRYGTFLKYRGIILMIKFFKFDFIERYERFN
jgi:hypothetical protein